MSPTIRARCSAQHRKPLAIVSALGGGQAIGNVSYPLTADPGLTGNLPANLFQSASHLLPAVGKLLATRIERTQPQRALLVASLFSRGQRLISNFSGGIIQALRSLLSRYPLVPVSPKTTSGRFQTFFLAPALLPVPVLHESNMQTKDARSHEQCTREYE